MTCTLSLNCLNPRSHLEKSVTVASYREGFVQKRKSHEVPTAREGRKQNPHKSLRPGKQMVTVSPLARHPNTELPRETSKTAPQRTPRSELQAVEDRRQLVLRACGRGARKSGQGVEWSALDIDSGQSV